MACGGEMTLISSCCYNSLSTGEELVQHLVTRANLSELAQSL